MGIVYLLHVRNQVDKNNNPKRNSEDVSIPEINERTRDMEERQNDYPSGRQ